MKKIILFLSLCIIFTVKAHAVIHVVTASQDLAAIAREVGGNLVTADSLARGNEDLHFVEPRPSMVMKMKKADLVVKIGMDLDIWMNSLIGAARNDKIVYGAPGYVDASVGIERLEVPAGKVDASMGDIHIYGNPHYWLDPANGRFIADNITDGLCRVSTEHCREFRQGDQRFKQQLEVKLKGWLAQMQPLKGAEIVTYHNSWIYFAKRFDLQIIGNIEPKPGLPPTPSHLNQLINTMKADKVNVIMMDPFYPLQGPQKVAGETGATIVVVPCSVGGQPDVKTYFDLFDSIIGNLKNAFRR